MSESGQSGKNMYYTYINKSEKSGQYYIGSTGNVYERLKQHNQGKSKSTRFGRPWKLIFNKEFNTRSEAIKYERYLKSFKKRTQLAKIITAG